MHPDQSESEHAVLVDQIEVPSEDTSINVESVEVSQHQLPRVEKEEEVGNLKCYLF